VMGLRTTVLAALEQRKRRKEEANERRRRADRAKALSAVELAERISNGDVSDPAARGWARRLPAQDRAN
jgi:hypothetical protein